MKALLGSKLIGWALVAGAVFVIAQAAGGPKKETKTATTLNSETQSQTEEVSLEAPKGGSVQSEKTSLYIWYSSNNRMAGCDPHSQ